MTTVNIHFAKTQLSRLIDEATAGGEVIIAKAGTPMVRLVPVTAAGTSRTLGALAGKITESRDCWAADPDIEEMFYGGPVEPERASRVAVRPPADKPAKRNSATKPAGTPTGKRTVKRPRTS